MQGVIEGTQVGVNLIVERTRQKAQAFTSLYCRTSQNNPVDLLGLEGLDCLSHGQVGLAGAGRTNTKNNRTGINSINIRLLVDGLRPDALAPRRQNVLANSRRRRQRRSQHGQKPGDHLLADQGISLNQSQQFPQQAQSESDRLRGASHHQIQALRPQT